MVKHLRIAIIIVLVTIANTTTVLGQNIFNKTSGYYRPDAYTSVHQSDTGYICAGLRYDSLIQKWNINFDWLDMNGNLLKSRWLRKDSTEYYLMWYGSTFVLNNSFITYSTITDNLTDLESPYGADIFFCKFNFEGDTIFTKRYNSGYFDVGYAITQTHSGDLVGVGRFASPGNPEYSRVIKYDSLGNIKWNRTYTPGFFSASSSVFTFPNGDICFGGEFKQASFDYNCKRVTLLDSIGTVKWSKKIPNTCDDATAFVTPLSDGNILVAGAKCINQPSTITSPRKKLCLTKLNYLNGDTIWERTYTTFRLGSENGLLFARELPNGEIIAGGLGYEFYEVNQIGDSLNSTVGIFIKTNANGDLIWKRNYKIHGLDSTNQQYIADAKPTNDGGFILVGRTSGYTWDDGWIIKTDANGCIDLSCVNGVEELDDDDFRLSIYPNPAEEYVSIDLPILYNSGVFQVYNLQGQLVISDIISTGGTQTFSIADMPNGIYQLVVYSSTNKLLGREKLVVAR